MTVAELIERLSALDQTSEVETRIYAQNGYGAYAWARVDDVVATANGPVPRVKLTGEEER